MDGDMKGGKQFHSIRHYALRDRTAIFFRPATVTWIKYALPPRCTLVYNYNLQCTYLVEVFIQSDLRERINMARKPSLSSSKLHSNDCLYQTLCHKTCNTKILQVFLIWINSPYILCFKATHGYNTWVHSHSHPFLSLPMSCHPPVMAAFETILLVHPNIVHEATSQAKITVHYIWSVNPPVSHIVLILCS